MPVGGMKPVWRVNVLLWLQMPLATQNFEAACLQWLQSSDVLIAVSMQINKEGMQIQIIDDAQV